MEAKNIAIFCIMAAAVTTAAMATIQDDEKDCADQLTNLAACIPFVSGSASRPTPECCESTKKLKSAKPKCLCVLIKESADPSMGLPINTTLAMQMPSACNIDAKASDCPSILNIPADSPDAKIFKGADDGGSTTQTPTTPSSSSSSSSSSPSHDKTSDSKTAPLNNGVQVLKGSFFVMIIAFASFSL